MQDRIRSLLRKKDSKKAQEAFGALFGLLLSQKKRGVYDGDRSLCASFGLIEKMRVQFDEGRYELDGTYSPNKLINSRDNLLTYLQQRCPELSPSLEEAFQEAWREPGVD